MKQIPIVGRCKAAIKRPTSSKIKRSMPKRNIVPPPTDEYFIETRVKSDKKRWTLWVYGGGRNAVLDGWNRSETTWEKRCRLKHKTAKFKL
jgi:hypothetical protein